MRRMILSLILFAWVPLAALGCAGTEDPPLVFGVYAPDEHALQNVALLVESVRAFGGAQKDAPFWVYVPPDSIAADSPTRAKLAALGATLKISEAPAGTDWFLFSGKIFAAARAEAEAEGHTPILAWLNEDTLVLQEPAGFLLPPDKAIGYRPVMHKNVGLLFNEPLDPFWGRILEKMAVPEAALFPMVTPADEDTIRPYFNAGCLIVRPERGLLRAWQDYFTVLIQDSVLVEMCREDVRKRIFIHQTALTGAILNRLDRDELLELSNRINYPIFFQQMFGAKKEFNDITGVVTLRHESYFSNPASDWDRKLRGPADRIAWMKDRLGPQGE